MQMQATEVTLSAERWAGFATRLDRIVLDAARAYLQGLRARGVSIDPEGWARELERLIRGAPIDYGREGLPLMYALRYMPKRVVALLGALEGGLGVPPDTLLDIGTGTGATLVALQLLHPMASTKVTGLDASMEMLDFARQTQADRVQPASIVYGTIEALMEDPTPFASAEVVTFSAPFARNFDQWPRLVDALSRPAHTTRRLVVVEPSFRVHLVDGFQSALDQRGWQTTRSGSATARLHEGSSRLAQPRQAVAAARFAGELPASDLVGAARRRVPVCVEVVNDRPSAHKT